MCSQRHRQRRRGEDDRVGFGSGERRGRVDRRLGGRAHGPDLPARSELLRRRTRSRTRSTAARRRPCRSPSRVSTTRRRRSTTARRVVEDSPAGAIAVLANDTDTDGGPRSVASVMQPANGTVVITGAGSGLTYQPNANFCNAPDARTLSRTRSTAATRPPCRSPSRVSTTRRRRSTTARRLPRARPRPRSTCWRTTPTSTAVRSWSKRSPSRRTARW